MARIVFHVGMGKTGSTTLQSALRANTDALKADGHHYLGQWLGMIHPDFVGYDGFQRFLTQTPDELTSHALTLIAEIKRIEAAGGAQSFILSNEQYARNIPKLSGFFKAIAAQADLRVIMYVRSPAHWLPSAYVQWGVAHKAHSGPVRSFAVRAREVMRQYDHVLVWKEVLGQAVTIRAYGEKADIVQDFCSAVGISMGAEPARRQVRPSAAETILRAACNSAMPGPVHPRVFDAARVQYLPPGTPARMSEKFSQLFDWSELSEILAENSEVISFIEQEIGCSFATDAPVPPAYDAAALTDELLGTLTSMVFGQAHEIRDLKASIETLTRELSELRTELAAK